MTKTAVGHDGYECPHPRMKGKQRCVWHWLMAQSAEVQAEAAKRRLNLPMRPSSTHRARVPEAEWPDGERWCAGCQSFIPLFYTSGSRCKSCASTAAHRARVQKVYGLEPGEYDKLLELQGGRCFICGRRSPSRRLAVDHDHVTGRVRGLLCPDPERGCNHAILGNIRDVDMARRILLYLARTPYDRLDDILSGEGDGAELTWDRYVAQEWTRIARAAAHEALRERAAGPRVVDLDPPPF